MVRKRGEGLDEIGLDKPNSSDRPNASSPASSEKKPAPKGLEEVLSDTGNPPIMHQLARTFWALKMVFEKRLKQGHSEITGPSTWILLLLARRDCRSQAEITEAMRVDASATTRLVKMMEQEGLITREADPKDNRRTLVYLTEQGRNRTKGLAELAQSYEDEITGKLSPEHLAQLRAGLHILEETARALSNLAVPPTDAPD